MFLLYYFSLLSTKSSLLMEISLTLFHLSTKRWVFVEMKSLLLCLSTKRWVFVDRAKQKPHKNAEPTQKHKTLICTRPLSDLFVQYFSIFLSGCKQPNLSTFPAVLQGPCYFSGCKDTQKNHIAIFCMKFLLNCYYREIKSCFSSCRNQ